MSFQPEEHDEATLERHERRITRRRSCNARIVFVTTAAGKQMPCEADSVDAADTEFDPKRHESHFATCPQAQQHRKPR